VVAAAGGSFLIPISVPAQEINPKVWQPNGPVFAVVATDSSIFVGGAFNYIGPTTHGAAFLKKMDGRVLSPSGFVNGNVYTIVSDGAGGWYIAGWFDQVFGLSRTNLAHLRSDLSVSDWNPSIQTTDGEIRNLAIGDGVIYVAGTFTKIGGKNREHVAAIDIATGTVTSWNPGIDGSVSCIATDGSAVYAGGHFHYVNGFPGVERDNIAAFDAQTGIATPWNPGAYEGITALLLHDGVLYVGGYGNLPLVALDPQTGSWLPWNPQIEGGGVGALAIRGTSLYIGGTFTKVRNLDRTGVAEVNIATAIPTSWNPYLVGSEYPFYRPIVSWITVGADALYLSGDFRSINGASYSSVGAVDFATGLGTTWRPSRPRFDGVVKVIQEMGEQVFVGGAFSSIGGEDCGYIAEINPNTGAAIPGAFTTNSRVETMALANETLYVGGSFTKAGGLDRNRMAAFDLRTRTLTGWNPSASSYSFSYVRLIAGNDVIYASGDFSTVMGQPRNGLAALNPESGEPTSWNPRPNGSARVLGVHDSIVYVDGSFTEIGGKMRSGLVALDSEIGAATSWDPHAVGWTSASLAADDFLYVAGSYSEIGGKNNVSLAQLDYASGAATDWSPIVAVGQIHSMAILDSTLYVGGTGHAGAVYIPTALTTEWELDSNGDMPIHGIAPRASTIFVGGGYFYYHDYYYTYLAAASADTSRPGAPPPPPPPPPPPQGPEVSLAISPNPASVRAEIYFSIPEDGEVELVIVDIAGREVGRLMHGHALAGTYHETFEAHQLAAGVYLAHCEYNGQTKTKKFVLVQ